MAKTQDTRIINRFKGYTVADCDCKLCLYYGGKKRGCKLDECCCADDKREAYEREGFVDTVTPCRG